MANIYFVWRFLYYQSANKCFFT